MIQAFLHRKNNASYNYGLVENLKEEKKGIPEKSLNQ